MNDIHNAHQVKSVQPAAIWQVRKNTKIQLLNRLGLFYFYFFSISLWDSFSYSPHILQPCLLYDFSHIDIFQN